MVQPSHFTSATSTRSSLAGNHQQGIINLPWLLPLKVVRYPDLQRLSLSMLPEISDASLVSVARHCRSLTSLALSYCPGISDRGLAQAAPYLHRLQHLHLSCCDNITDR